MPESAQYALGITVLVIAAYVLISKYLSAKKDRANQVPHHNPNDDGGRPNDDSPRI